MSTKLTPWFPSAVKPTRTGVYETRFTAWEGFSHWDGQNWGNQGHTKKAAIDWRRREGVTGAFQDKKWRGLAKAPK